MNKLDKKLHTENVVILMFGQKSKYTQKRKQKMEAAIQIIVPVYNAEETLPRCLDSIKGQTFSSWQAIVVNDASSDGSEEVIKSYAEKDSRFVYIKNETNKGVSAARNAALSKVSARFVAFIDADDFWEKDFLKRLFETAEESGADIVQCRYMYDYPNGKTHTPKGAFCGNRFFSADEKGQIYVKMATGIDFNHVCMKLIKSEILEGKTFDTSMKTAEDLAFNIELLSDVKKYVFLDEIYYHYCRSNNGLTGQSVAVKEKFRANRKVSKMMKKSLKSTGKGSTRLYFLILFRPYIIIVSKTVRILRDSFIKNRR